jgi:hypothetical protein
MSGIDPTLSAYRLVLANLRGDEVPLLDMDDDVEDVVCALVHWITGELVWSAALGSQLDQVVALAATPDDAATLRAVLAVTSRDDAVCARAIARVEDAITSRVLANVEAQFDTPDAGEPK